MMLVSGIFAGCADNKMVRPFEEEKPHFVAMKLMFSRVVRLGPVNVSRQTISLLKSYIHSIEIVRMVSKFLLHFNKAIHCISYHLLMQSNCDKVYRRLH